MKKKFLGVFLTVIFGCMVLSGCKKNVGTPEDNAVVEEEEGKKRRYTGTRRIYIWL